MTLEGFIGLFTAMVIVAIIPGPAVFAVSSASASGGFGRGFNMTIGLVLADFLFILLAVSGLAYIADALSGLFTVLRYCCAFYLVWMGMSLLLSKPNSVSASSSRVNSSSDILAGFLLTISNPKAIMFYVALFPAFVNFHELALFDVMGIMVCACLAFGTVNLFYALIAAQAGKLSSSNNQSNVFRKLAGTVLTMTGLGLATRA